MALFKKKKKEKEAAAGDDEEKGAAGDEKEEDAGNSAREEDGGEKTEGGEAKEGELSEEEEAAAKKRKTKKIVIAIACVVMLCVVAGAGAYFTGFIGHSKKEEEKTAKKDESGAPVFYDLPQLLVNLNTGSKTPSFIKVTITLELGSQEDIKNTQANMPRLLDSYNTFLREMKASDLYGSAGMYRLREEMLMRANTALAPIKVKDILFKEILVQ